MEESKIAVVIRKDLKLKRIEMIELGIRGVLKASCSRDVDFICFEIDTLNLLLDIEQDAKIKGLKTTLVESKKHTIDDPDFSCLVVGPGSHQLIDYVTSSLHIRRNNGIS